MKPVDHEVLKESVAAALQEYQREKERSDQLQTYQKIRANMSQEEFQRLIGSFREQPELMPEALQDTVVQRVREYIKQHIEEELSRDLIAEQVFLNPSYLSRLFHEETGEKLSVYIGRMKIEHAKELLQNTNEKITVIAQRSGYNNESYFIRIFCEAVGMTPSRYRKQLRREKKEE